jgi:hypothetical protein
MFNAAAAYWTGLGATFLCWLCRAGAPGCTAGAVMGGALARGLAPTIFLSMPPTTQLPRFADHPINQGTAITFLGSTMPVLPGGRIAGAINHQLTRYLALHCELISYLHAFNVSSFSLELLNQLMFRASNCSHRYLNQRYTAKSTFSPMMLSRTARCEVCPSTSTTAAPQPVTQRGVCLQHLSYFIVNCAYPAV